MADVTEVKDKATKILIKALDDADYRAKLKADPIDTMKKEGLSEEEAEEVGTEVKIDGEAIVTACSFTCMSWSHITLA